MTAPESPTSPLLADLLAAIDAYRESRKGPWADDDWGAIERAAAKARKVAT